jgi:SSS family transporter
MFIAWRLLWLATVIYVPALVLSSLTGLPLVPTVLAIGAFTTLYTSVGGIKAVIWTDFLQFFVMAGGAALAIVYVAGSLDGGAREIWQRAYEGGRVQSFSFSLDPNERLTVWGALVGGFFANLAFFTADQVIIQRYLTTRSAADLRRTFLLNCVGLTLMVVLLGGVGLALFAFYDANPGLLPGGAKDDNVFPHFIARQFPPGLVGLLLASILAATTSTLAAGINAVTTALYSDFLGRGPESSPGSPSSDLRLSRAVSVGVGAVATLMACFVGRLGTIMEIAVRFVDGFAGPLLAVFLLGMLFRRVRSVPALLGALVGVLLCAYFNFYSQVSFAWYPAIGCAGALASGLAFHVLLPEQLGGGTRLAPLRDAD